MLHYMKTLNIMSRDFWGHVGLSPKVIEPFVRRAPTPGQDDADKQRQQRHDAAQQVWHEHIHIVYSPAQHPFSISWELGLLSLKGGSNASSLASSFLVASRGRCEGPSRTVTQVGSASAARRKRATEQ